VWRCHVWADSITVTNGAGRPEMSLIFKVAVSRMNNDDQQEFHEGQVEAANRPDDAGAMFTVSLPLAA